MNDIMLRRETPEDYDSVEILTREAFWNHHGPGCDEHYLVHVMRGTPAFIPELDIVATRDGRIVGNIMYTRAALELDDGGSREVISFGPISVLPEYQWQGVGVALIEHTKRLAADMGFTAIFIYGDPDYYRRTGFVPAEDFGIGTDDDMYADALMACELKKDALEDSSGRFVVDVIYHLDPVAAEEFDRALPTKPIVKDTPSQQRFSMLVSQRRPRK